MQVCRNAATAVGTATGSALLVAGAATGCEFQTEQGEGPPIQTVASANRQITAAVKEAIPGATVKTIVIHRADQNPTPGKYNFAVSVKAGKGDYFLLGGDFNRKHNDTLDVSTVRHTTMPVDLGKIPKGGINSSADAIVDGKTGAIKIYDVNKGDKNNPFATVEKNTAYDTRFNKLSGNL